MVMDNGVLLPRSIRWRIQLGVLDMPPSLSPWTLEKDLMNHNRDKLSKQRKRYNDLHSRHHHNHQEEEEEEEEEEPTNTDNLMVTATTTPQEATTTTTTTTTTMLGPLTMLVQQQEAMEAQDRRHRLQNKLSGAEYGLTEVSLGSIPTKPNSFFPFPPTNACVCCVDTLVCRFCLHTHYSQSMSFVCVCCSLAFSSLDRIRQCSIPCTPLYIHAVA